MKIESWTVDFFREWYPYMDLRSVARFRSYILRRDRRRAQPGETILLRMKRPFEGTVRLREWGTDFYTFDEIAVREVYRSVVSGIPAPHTVIDLGANIGLASLYFAHHWPTCRIFAIEPNAETYELLASNLSDLARLGRCGTLRAGVWDTNADLDSVPGLPPGGFDSYSLKEAATSHRGCGTVPGLAMREIIERSQFGEIGLLKVDIEGSEVRLFSGDMGWLERVATIAIEFHGRAREESRFDQIMAANGFRLRAEGEHTVVFSKGGSN